MSERIVSPPFEELHTLRTPLNEGEEIVLNFFMSSLPREWEIYIQPHLNGLRPDFVLLNPLVGIAVFEVKDWNLDAMHYYISETSENPELWAIKKNGKPFRLMDNPVHKAYLYRKCIKELYAPEIGTQCDEGNERSIALITSGIIFTKESTKRVKDLLSPLFDKDWSRKNSKSQKYMPLSGIDLIEAKDIKTVLPATERNTSLYMNNEIAQQLRGWLIEPDFAREQRQPLELNSKQRVLATTRTKSGYRRIRGVVGSGKSLVLASRAGNLASENKEVLVVTFNITLWHYLRDLIVRCLKPNVKINRNITFTHFHDWCKNMLYKCGMRDEYNLLFKSNENIDEILETKLPALVNEALNRVVEIESFTDTKLERYDAILIDEGQDYNIYWWNTLRRVLNEDGEIVLVADEAQDLFKRADKWTDQEMIGAGFSGPWSQLDICYRCPGNLTKYLRKFAEEHLQKVKFEQINFESEKLDLYSANLVWIQVSSESLLPNWCVRAFFDIPSAMSPSVVAFSDLTIVLPTHKIGLSVVDLLRNQGLELLHIFDIDSRDQKPKKMKFFMGDAHAKACTIHSFKGWEARYIVVGITETTDLSAVYVAMSRLKRHAEGSCLMVVCSNPLLYDYGQSWPEFKFIHELPDRYSSSNQSSMKYINPSHIENLSSTPSPPTPLPEGMAYFLKSRKLPDFKLDEI